MNEYYNDKTIPRSIPKRHFFTNHPSTKFHKNFGGLYFPPRSHTTALVFNWFLSSFYVLVSIEGTRDYAVSFQQIPRAMKFLNSIESKAQSHLIFNFARQNLGADLAYSVSAEVLERVNHPLSIYSSATTDDGKEIIAFISAAITTDRFYRKLISGQAKEEDFEPWDEKDTPILFLRNFVTKDRHATPYLFRNALKELHHTCALHDIYLHRAFTVAHHWTMRRALENFQFQRTGTYLEKYPIMLASRDTSIVLNSFLKQYDASAPLID